VLLETHHLRFVTVLARRNDLLLDVLHAAAVVRRRMDGGVSETAENIAKEFHESYEANAPRFSYKTRIASRVPWEDVPENNRRLMIEVCRDLLARGIIMPGPNTILPPG
jgi:hypothetical protein